MYINNFVVIMTTFRTKARLAGAMDTLRGNAMICKHLVIPHCYIHKIGKKYNKYKANSRRGTQAA